MSGGARALAITESFYAWEVRGRGWDLASYPVVLEPPFRHCTLLSAYAEPALPIDDGHRPTILSSLVAGIKEAFGERKVAAPAPPELVEPAPHPADTDEALSTFEVRIAESYGSGSDIAEELLRALASAMQPVAVEFIAGAGKVSLHVTCRTADQDLVRGSLEGYVPEASVLATEDRLQEVWHGGQASIVVDFGLAEEFFLPLRTFRSFRVDPYIPLTFGLARTEEGEVVALQVLFERTRNPWSKATMHALTDSQGGSIFADAPEFIPLAKEKLGTPLFAVTLRVGACAKTRARALELARGVAPFVHQFERPGGNSFIPLENDDYPDELHALAFLSRSTYRTGMLLSASELVGLVHVPDASVRHPGFVREVTRSKGAPSFTRGHDWILGRNTHRGDERLVSLDEASRLQHVHVLGASGTGKSTLLIQLITQDIEAGRGCAVLDPHGDLIEDLLARIPEGRTDDVVLFDPSDEEFPVGLNVLSARTALERQLLASDLVGVFQRLSTSWGDTMGTVLGNAILAILEHPEGGTLLDLRRFLIDDAFRKRFVAGIDDDEVQLFWSKGFGLIGSRSIGPILTRLDAFLRPKLIRHIVGQKVPKLDLGAVLSRGQIFLAKLSQGLIGAENASLLGSLIATRLHQLALARQAAARSSRRSFFLYADEAQYFVTPSMASLLTDVRKYGFGLVLAHQNLFQIRGTPVESALLGNAYTRIAFRVGDEDAKKLAEGCSFFEARDFRALERGEAIARIGSANYDFNLTTLPLAPVPPGAASARRSAVVQASREHFAASLADVKRALSIAPEPPSGSPSAAAEVGVAPPPSKPVARAADAATAPRPAAPVSEPPTLGRGGQAHKYLQHLVKRLAEERGFRAVIEAAVSGGQVDVALHREALSIAVEVSVSTDVDHERANVEKCLAGGFQHVVLLAEDTRRATQYRRAFTDVIAVRSVRVLEPSELAEFLDAFEVPAFSAEQVVRGYKVRVSRQAFTPEEAAKRRQAVAKTIARSLGKERAGN